MLLPFTAVNVSMFQRPFESIALSLPPAISQAMVLRTPEMSNHGLLWGGANPLTATETKTNPEAREVRL
jgi:hypothetical protein